MPVKQKSPLSCDHRIAPDCGRCVLNLLHLQMMQTKNNHAYSQIQLLLRQFKQVVDQEGVISLAIGGRVQFITSRAKHLLQHYFACQASHILPVPLQQWFKEQTSQLTHNSNGLCTSFPFYMEQAGRRLIIHLISDPIEDQYLLLLLEEQELSLFSISSLKSLGLTTREAEVLFWVAKDKSNVEIAKVLDCCEGTIRKHLEHLYKKLEVQTRMGAVMTALERLGLLQA